MSHALATVLHRGRKAASNVMAACLASSQIKNSKLRDGGEGSTFLLSTSGETLHGEFKLVA